MKILYGVVGEGMGHAMRSAVVLEHLKTSGHEVRVVVSGRAAEYLETRYPGCVTRITGLTMRYEDNVVRKMKTAFENLKSIAGVPSNLKRYLEMAADFQPEVVISDFESWTYLFARGQKIPVVSIDNMQIIARCHHDASVLTDMKSFLLAKGLVKAKLPRANAYLVTTFFFPELKKDRTTLHPPILRNEVLDAKAGATQGDHVVVYQSGTSHESLLDALTAVDIPFRVYGLRRDIEAPQTEGNITHCPFSETEFINDLAGARAVVAGGGFTLMGEVIYLGKPLLSVPLGGQFEQQLNAAYLQQLGYGEQAEAITAERLSGFVDRADTYASNLANFAHDGNNGLLSTLDDTLVRAIEEGPRA